MSDMFKTSQMYRYQPVTMTALIDLYILYIRPQTDSKYLFVTNTGTKLGQGYVGRSVTQYYALFGLDICTTTVRKLIEVRCCMWLVHEYYICVMYVTTVMIVKTACQAALDDQVITNEEYMRSCTGQGHSLQTARQYYKVSDQCRSAYSVVMGDGPHTPVGVETLTALTASAHIVTPASGPVIQTPPTPPTPVAVEDQLSVGVIDEPDDDMDWSNEPSVAAAVKAVYETSAHMKQHQADVAGGGSPLPSSPLKRKFRLEDGVDKISSRAMKMEQVGAALSPLGLEHPEYVGQSVRVPASDEEKTWLFNYYNRNDDFQVGQVGRTNLFRRCLDAILVQNDARVLFHQRHVYNSDRLKTCSLPVIKEVKQYRDDGMYPAWYIDTIPNVYNDEN